MSKVGNRESGKPPILHFLKNNRFFSCIIQENFVPLHCRCKTGKASKICGITIEKIFHGHLGNFS